MKPILFKPGFKIRQLAFLLSILFFSIEMYSQAFLPAYQPTIGKKEGYVILKDSTKIEGTFSLINHTKNIKSCTIKDNNGKKHKLKAAQIEKIYILVTGLDKLNALSEVTMGIKELLELDITEVLQPEYYVWENTRTNIKGKMKVLQLINPSFDNKLKVFRDPTAIQHESSEFSGSQELSYFVIRNGRNTAHKIKKPAYKSQFEQLFADCPELIEAFAKKKLRWKDFASHVFLYEQLKK